MPCSCSRTSRRKTRPPPSSTFRRLPTKRAVTSSIPAKISKRRRRATTKAGSPDILFQTKDPARFGKLTTANLQKPLGIFLDHRYISAPIIQSPIYDNGQITGSFTRRTDGHARQRAQRRRASGQHQIIEKETIGPTLGKIDLHSVDARSGARTRPRLDLHDRSSTACRAFSPTSRSRSTCS